ncbi:beta-hexosaminidase 1 isoform X2 [Rhododendron vialii]|uniref:beta-hexosaminidase 1 isoform X2 n=1 Tax=Rhododendron vialii TaxID=182163 RepID=UPI00265F1F24|nr:beta-hexosaminidase 1 isoform X2 [Rhododendron vialii]
MASDSATPNPSPLLICIYTVFLCISVSTSVSALVHAQTLSLGSKHNSTSQLKDSLVYLWPLPAEYTFGNGTLSVDPDLSLAVGGSGGNSAIVRDAFERYRAIIFKHGPSNFRPMKSHISKVRVVVHSDNEELQLGTDESYSLIVAESDDRSIIAEATIETFSQLCTYDYETKSIHIYKAPWYVRDRPRFAFRGLLLDTSRHYYPVDVIKQIIESMSYAKLNVLHWHIIDEESFPLEVPTYPKLWKGAYSKWERYTIEDADEIVNFAKRRGINVMAEVDVPGHAESWGAGYPDLWPSASCREPLDVSKKFTFDLIAGILTDMRKIFPFELFHLGGDEVHTDCWTSTPHVQQWLRDHNMTAKDAYQYFVLRAQQIAISKKWTPVNWEETFNAFPTKLNPRTVVHNWLGAGVCPKAVGQGFRCIFSNQGFWYLDHLDVQWDGVYNAEPLEGISDVSEQQLVLGGEVCMWGETADPSVVQQTIWPRAAAAAERLWSKREATSTRNINITALPRLEYFRCLLTRRGVPAAPVINFYARSPPSGPGSCYEQ